MTATTSTTDGNGTTHVFDVHDKLSAGIQSTRTGPNQQVLTPIVRGRTMLFIPKAVSQVEQVPMLVYYHGHHGPDTIEGYIRQKTERDFRPLLKDAKVLLVEPQGGPFSKFGALGTPAGLSILIWRVMQKAFELGPPARPVPRPVPNPPSLILAGFSGGGAALNSVVFKSKADYMKLLTEVWCFDSMYSGEGQDWINWAKTSKKMLRVRVSAEEAKGSPGRQAESMRKSMTEALRSVIDIEKPGTATHEGLPSSFIQGWLKN
jgi:hypothetical protein